MSPKPTAASPLPGFDRATVVLLTAASVYLLIALGSAILSTTLIEQDAAYYCEVAERFAAGEGLNSLADRRGRGPSRPWPIPFEATTWWPVPLAGLVKVFGSAQLAGSFASLLALIGALWVGTRAVQLAAKAPSLTAGLCVVAALMHRKACEPAILPLTDGLSLFANAAVLLAIVRRKVVAALVLAAVAVGIRYQNVALALPLLALLPVGAPRARIIAAALAATLAAAFWHAGPTVLEGLGVLVNPAHRDSLPRAIRWLTLGLVVGLIAARHRPAITPLWLLAAGHVLVLLANHVPSEARGWLFANRHGLPLHLTAAGLACLAVMRARGWLWVAVVVTIGVAGLENGARPVKTLMKVGEVTGRLDMQLTLDHLRRHPLPVDAIVLCHDCDVLAHELGIRGVHLRSHQPDPPGSERGPFVRSVQDRTISHVLLTWQQNRHMVGRNAWMDGFERCLEPHTDLIVDLRRGDGRARALLLRVRR